MQPKNNLEFREKKYQFNYQKLLTNILHTFRSNSVLLLKMRQMPRWEKYFTQEGEKSKDMNELGHALTTYQIAKKLTYQDCNTGKITQNEKAYIRILALIHDLGEIGYGDINYNETTKETVKKETEFFENNLSFLLPGLSKEEYGTILTLYRQNVHNKDLSQKEAEYFNVVERLGYLMTAIEIFKQKPDNISWQDLCSNVITNHTKIIGEYIKKYPSMTKYLSKKIGDLENIIEFIKSTDDGSQKQNLEIWKEIITFLKQPTKDAD